MPLIFNKPQGQTNWGIKGIMEISMGEARISQSDRAGQFAVLELLTNISDLLNPWVKWNCYAVSLSKFVWISRFHQIK